MKNCKEYILENLKQISFRGDIVLPHPGDEYDKFVIKEKIINWENNAYINIEEVAGLLIGDRHTFHIKFSN